MKISVIGAGGFGTVIANLLAINGHEVRLWARDVEVKESINQEHKNYKYMQNLTLDNKIIATNDLRECLEGMDVIFFATPSQYALGVLEQMRQFTNPKQIIVSLVKGFVSGEQFFFSQVLSKILNHPEDNILVLCGPNLAKEIAEHKITATVLAGINQENLIQVKNLLANSWFLVYLSADMLGVQLGGGIKNIYAIASGIVHSRDYGNNCFSLLITNSIREIMLFADKIAANKETIMGLAGIGDLITTCTSELSRNYRLGVYLGKGFSIEQSKNLLSGEAEGYRTAETVFHKSKELDLELPILSSIYRILYEGQDAHILIEALKFQNG